MDRLGGWALGGYSDFLANMSHDLHTPLNAIIGFSEMLAEGMLGELNERQQGYVVDILASGRQLLALIDDIIDLSMVEAGRVELEVSEFSVRELLDYALGLVRAWSIRGGLTLTLDVEPSIGSVHADERKIKQVLLTLLSNALRVTPPGGTVVVRSWRALDGGALHVSVRDSGIGVEPTRTGDASGLSLALAEKFVELHEGQMWVERQPGQGSTFTFSLPLDARAAPVEASPDATSPAVVDVA